MLFEFLYFGFLTPLIFISMDGLKAIMDNVHNYVDSSSRHHPIELSQCLTEINYLIVFSLLRPGG